MILQLAAERSLIDLERDGKAKMEACLKMGIICAWEGINV